MRDVYLTPSFRERELRCRCRRPECDAAPMDKAHMAKLQAMRDACGFQFVVSSGSRCAHWNRVCGGKPDSWHLRGLATDVLYFSEAQRDRMVQEAANAGFGGIGIYPTFIHIDSGPAGRRWNGPN